MWRCGAIPAQLRYPRRIADALRSNRISYQASSAQQSGVGQSGSVFQPVRPAQAAAAATGTARGAPVPSRRRKRVPCGARCFFSFLTRYFNTLQLTHILRILERLLCTYLKLSACRGLNRRTQPIGAHKAECNMHPNDPTQASSQQRSPDPPHLSLSHGETMYYYCSTMVVHKTHMDIVPRLFASWSCLSTRHPHALSTAHGAKVIPCRQGTFNEQSAEHGRMSLVFREASSTHSAAAAAKPGTPLLALIKREGQRQRQPQPSTPCCPSGSGGGAHPLLQVPRPPLKRTRWRCLRVPPPSRSSSGASRS